MRNILLGISCRLGAGQSGAADLHLLSRVSKYPGGISWRSARLGVEDISPGVALKKRFQSCGEAQSEKFELWIAASRN